MKLTYTELMKLDTFEDRFAYLKLNGKVGSDTFGFERFLNQSFYHSDAWKKFRNEIILRDKACDLGVDGYEMNDHIIIHHMNPITLDDLVHFNPDVMNPEYVICVSDETHKAIHYGSEKILRRVPVERRAGDTCPWK